MKIEKIMTLRQVQYIKSDSIYTEPKGILTDEEGDLIPINRGELKQYTLKCHILGQVEEYRKENTRNDKGANIDIGTIKVECISSDANIVKNYKGDIIQAIENYVNSLQVDKYCYISAVNLVTLSYSVVWFTKAEYISFLCRFYRVDTSNKIIRLKNYLLIDKALLPF